MKYASVCSGVEAPTVAWKNLGWEAVWFSQYDPENNYKKGNDFPSEVLAYHYPNTPNLGDMTKLREKNEYRESDFNVLIGGTPCQSFSIAGLRKGLSDERGNLALEFCRILNEKKPQWFIWENVPGVLSSNKGEDFKNIVNAFTEIGYGISWRVLDAQFFGVPQRRRRVFVVGYFGDWKPSTQVLFEPESLLRYLKKSRKEMQKNTGNFKKSSSYAIRTANTTANGRGIEEGLAYTLDRANGQAVFLPKINACLETTSHDYSRADGFASIVESKAFVQNSRDEVRFQNENGLIVGSLSAQPGMKQQNYILKDSKVRKLTPVECERLQGFPDNYTKIPYRNKTIEDCPDGHRYKAMGNSMAVPVIKWLGERIEFYNLLNHSRE